MRGLATRVATGVGLGSGGVAMSELTRRYVVMTMAAAAPFDPADHDAPFVLKPWKDPAALIALKSYRDHCYPELARDLDEWIRLVEAGPLVLGGVGRRNEAHLTSEKRASRPEGEAERPGREEDRRPFATEGQGQAPGRSAARRAPKPEEAPPMTDRCVEALLRARSHRERCAPPSEEQPLSMAEAYAVQDRRARGARRPGRAGDRLEGRLHGQGGPGDVPVSRARQCAFSSGPACMPNRAEVPIARFVQLVVEAEIALGSEARPRRAGRRAPDGAAGRRGGRSGARAGRLSLLGQAHRQRPGGRRRLRERHRAGGVAHRRPHLDLALEGLVYEHNGAVVATNTAAEVLGNPHQLAGVDRQPSRCARTRAHSRPGRDDGLRVQARAPRAGDTVRATYTRLGSVSARFV